MAKLLSTNLIYKVHTLEIIVYIRYIIWNDFILTLIFETLSYILKYSKLVT